MLHDDYGFYNLKYFISVIACTYETASADICQPKEMYFLIALRAVVTSERTCRGR
jgi:hypothetical protein